MQIPSSSFSGRSPQLLDAGSQLPPSAPANRPVALAGQSNSVQFGQPSASDMSFADPTAEQSPSLLSLLLKRSDTPSGGATDGPSGTAATQPSCATSNIQGAQKTVNTSNATATPAPANSADGAFLDDSKYSSPKDLEKWAPLVANLPADQREAAEKALNRPIAAARMAAEKGPDSAKAMDFINANPSLKNAVDVGKHGGKADGKITDGDLKSFAGKMEGAADKAGKDIADYQKKNPNADPQSLEMVRSASLLQANQPLASAADPKHAQGAEGETGVDRYINADGVAALAKDNPGLGGPLKQAATTFSQPGFLNMLDQGGLSGRDLATHSPDKKFDSANISNWIKNQAPTTGGEFSSMLSDAATLNAVANVDISKLDKDVFEEPENYTGEQKAAVMVKLQQTQQSVSAGSDLRKTGDTEKALNDKIGQLQADPDVQAFMNKAVPDQERNLVGSDPSLQEAVKTQYQSLLSGKALKSDMDTADKAADKDKNKDANPDYSSAIGGLSSQLQMQQDLMGPDAQVPSAQQIVSDNPGMQDKLARSYQANFTEGGSVKQLLGQKKTDASTALATADAQKASYETVLPQNFLQRQQDGYVNSTMSQLQDSKKGRDFLKKPADGQEDVKDKSSKVSNAEKLASQGGPNLLNAVTGFASVSGMLQRGDKTGAAQTIYDSSKSGISAAKNGYDAVAKMAGRDASAGLGRMAGQVGGRVAGMIAGEATGLAAAEAIGAAAGPVGWVIDAAMSIGFGIAAIIAAVKKHNAQKAFDHNVDPTLDQFGIPKPK